VAKLVPSRHRVRPLSHHHATPLCTVLLTTVCLSPLAPIRAQATRLDSLDAFVKAQMALRQVRGLALRDQRRKDRRRPRLRRRRRLDEGAGYDVDSLPGRAENLLAMDSTSFGSRGR
jgi:hypothetical protein